MNRPQSAVVGASLALAALGWLASPHGSAGQLGGIGSPESARGAAQAANRARVLSGAGPVVEGLAPDALSGPPSGTLSEGFPAPEGYALGFRHYPTNAELAAFLRDLEADHPDLLEVFEIGRSAQGRPLLAARVGSDRPDRPFADRPAMYIDGQHHARELVSQSVALYTLWWLVDRYEDDPRVRHLLDSRVLYVVPSVNPDGNDIALTDDQTLRKTASPTACDDDGDRVFDEDGTTGYGLGSHTLYLYRFDQAWADAHPDDPFVDAWRNHLVRDDPIVELGRHTGAYGGPERPVRATDEDADGRTDEDGPGGTDPNRNYDTHWAQGVGMCLTPDYRGSEPFSEPETRAVRDLLATIDGLSTALSYHSGVDVILHPWGHSATADLPDDWLFELVGRKGSQLTEVNGFPGSPHTWTARGLYDAGGSTMDYLYDQHGAYAFSPEVFGGSGRTRMARIGATGTFTVGMATSAVYNPPPDRILATTDRWNRFAVFLLAATPNVELWSMTVADDAMILRVGNDGALPVDVRAEISSAAGTSQQLGPTRLAASGATWSVSLTGLGDGPYELRLEALQSTYTRPHAVQRARWRFDVSEDGARLLEGAMGRPPELAEMFPDGWWADERWDEPGRYHLPPDMPISVTPRPVPTPTATVAPTATVTPTATPPPSATASPTASATAAPTRTATALPTRTATALLTGTATALPTGTATALPTDTATALPTETITASPTGAAPSATPLSPAWRLYAPWAVRRPTVWPGT